jgi:hypothetical protein
MPTWNLSEKRVLAVLGLGLVEVFCSLQHSFSIGEIPSSSNRTRIDEKARFR